MNQVNNRSTHPGLWQQPQAFAWQQTAQQQDQALAQAISNLQPSKKWVTLIGYPATDTHKALLQQLLNSGISRERIRWVHPQDQDTMAWATEQALLLDNSELIIAWLGQCQGRSLRRAELAAKVSHTDAFIFTDNNFLTPLH